MYLWVIAVLIGIVAMFGVIMLEPSQTIQGMECTTVEEVIIDGFKGDKLCKVTQEK